jgi:phospholipid/cholesterol/gamma-HCH transport system substrate-binding protein
MDRDCREEKGTEVDARAARQGLRDIMIERLPGLWFQGEANVSRVLSRPQALLLGLLVLLGVGLAVVGVFAVGSRGWFGKDPLHVQVGFHEIRGVEVGTRVRIQGMDAGEVVAILPPDSPDGSVVLRLALKDDYRRLVRSTSRVQIVSEGMLGGKVLEIHRRPPKTGQSDEPAAENALLESEASTELADVLGQVKQTLQGIQGGEGTLGKLAHDPQVYDELATTIRQVRVTMASIGQSADAVKHMPVVRDYVEDPTGLLVRPNCERNRQYFAESELFEPGRAVLTTQGRQRLDTLAPWLEGMKHKGSEVVVVAYADPKKATPSLAQTLTRQQSEAVCDYLKKQHAVQKMGWFTSRKVTPLGQGVQPPPTPERDALPPARVEVLVFVPQG